MKTFLQNHEQSSSSTTPPTQQAQPPLTPRTQRRAEIRDANNVLTDSPYRRRRRPIAPALPVEPPPPPPRLPIRRQPADRHLLARQPLDSLMNVAHSLSPMNVAYSFFSCLFSDN